MSTFRQAGPAAAARTATPSVSSSNMYPVVSSAPPVPTRPVTPATHSHIHTIHDYQHDEEPGLMHDVDLEAGHGPVVHAAPVAAPHKNIVTIHDIRAQHGPPVQPAHKPVSAVKPAAAAAAAVGAAAAAHHHHTHTAARKRSASRAESNLPDVNVNAPFPLPLVNRNKRQIFPNFKWLSITNLLVLGCTIVMAIELILGATDYDGAFVHDNPMGGPSVKTMVRMGAKWEPYIRNHGQGWRLLTAIFLHSGLLHWGLNMLTLAVVGYTCEQRFRPWWYSIIYLATGVLGNMWSCVTYSDSVGVGASGAIFGLIGAQLAHLLYNWSLIEGAILEFIMLIVVAVIGIILGFLSIVSANLDTYAHLGGFVCGIVLGFAITPFPRKRHWIVEVLVRLAGVCGTVALFVLFSCLLWIHDPHGPENVTNI